MESTSGSPVGILDPVAGISSESSCSSTRSITVMRKSESSLQSDLLQRAQALTPRLESKIITPVARVQLHQDPSELLGWRTSRVIDSSSVPASASELLRAPSNTVVFDFGAHVVGHFSVRVLGIPRPKPPGDIHGSHVDAPARLRITFGEVARDVAEEFQPYKGWLAESWLPQEILNVDFLPHLLRVPRRHAFRYVKVEVLATSDNFDVRLADAQAEGVSSMVDALLPPALTRESFVRAGWEDVLEEAEVDVLVEVDRVAVSTLRGCMQTVLEDGPRRDRRLWLGDLRVQALTFYSLGLRDYSLIKRCILLHAALPYDEDGRVAACIFEHPEPHAGNNFILDYSLLFGVTLKEYVDASADEALGRELFHIGVTQLELALKSVDDHWLFHDPGGIWLFVDWVENLDRQAALQGVLIIACHALAELAARLQLSPPSAHLIDGNSLPLDEIAGKLIDAARKSLWDADRQLFVSGSLRQVSWAGNAWLILADACPIAAGECMKALQAAEGAVAPKTPYGHQYVVEALLHAGLREEALRYIARYWGSMVKAGADTFFEAWDPADPQFSPYGDAHVNSYCHGWSCTPSYLLRSRLGLR